MRVKFTSGDVETEIEGTLAEIRAYQENSRHRFIQPQPNPPPGSFSDYWRTVDCKMSNGFYIPVKEAWEAGFKAATSMRVATL